MRKASWSVVATVTSKFLRDRCEARYLAIAASSSTIRTRVLSFMPVSWIWPEKVGLDKSAAGQNLALLIVLRFHFQVFGCLQGKLAQEIARIAGIAKIVRLKGLFKFRRFWQYVNSANCPCGSGRDRSTLNVISRRMVQSAGSLPRNEVVGRPRPAHHNLDSGQITCRHLPGNQVFINRPLPPHRPKLLE